jgi:hypothetical protein
MKKIYILVVLAALATTSCEDYLNTEPTDKIALEQYYTDEEGLNHVLAGVYDILGSNNIYGVNLWKSLEVATDEGYYARNTVTTGTEVNNYDPTNAVVTNYWKDLYVGINRANDLIANINVPKMDEDKRQVILGEALFLRGYFYFMLVSRFGDVPLRLTPTTSPMGIQIARTASKDVYAQILKDMTEAEAKVASNKYEYSGRVSKTVVQGILARVFLQMAGYPLNDTPKYADALAYAKKVIDSGERGLNTSFNTAATFNTFNPTIAANTANNAYRQIFINAAQNVYDTRESIWEVEFMGNQTDGYSERGGLGAQNGIIFTNATLYPTVGYSYGFIKGTARLFNKYDATGKDLRRDWVLTTYTLNGTTAARTALPFTAGNTYGRDCGKWRREYEAISPKAKNDSGINFPILRYADILLMYAEAENQVNGPTAAAYDAVNQVRRRAYGFPIGTPNAVSDLSAGQDKTVFQQSIEDERMRELCFEGQRRMDLIRWNKYVTTLNSVGAEISANTLNTGQRYGGLGGTSTAARHLLLPIPSLEIASNKLATQNEGW